MNFVLDYLSSTGGFTPHGFCLAWDPHVLYTHLAADALITLSYLSIPITIFVIVRKRLDRKHQRLAVLFALFILLCGLSHAMSIVTLYEPLYGLQGVIKLMTGIVSFITAIVVWQLLPKLLAAPSEEAYQHTIARLEHEITQRNEAEEKLSRAEASLKKRLIEVEETNEQLSDFAYASSHDLKAPANTLSLLLNEIEDDHASQLNEEGRETLTLARDLVARMRILIEDILSYARIVNSSRDQITEVDLEKIFNETIGDLQCVIKQTDARITIDKLPTIEGIPSQIRILAHNLLTNALKFRDPSRSPQVEISSREVASPAGDIGGGVEIKVKDNGIGIAPEFHDQIFKLFKRLHRKEEIPGTGLGLSLCHRVALSHGGSIGVASDVGEGTTFTVTLPREGLK